jgi:dTDP-4-amino-4,6-dideoxygalactose transaminase
MILTQSGTAPTPDNFKIAEEGLLAQTGGKLAVWSGRAATAFYHAYRLAMRRRPNVQAPEIIMPAMSCTTAANVAAMMGIKPRFADNWKFDSDYNPPRYASHTYLQSIQKRFNSNTVAVVAIHLFGNEVGLDEIKSWCQSKQILLIDDPTQALSGKYLSRDFLGSKGDLALYSFNKTKIIEVGNGVLIANTDEIAAELEQLLAEEKTPFPNFSDKKRSELALSYRNMHHSLVSVLRENPQNISVVSQTFLEKRSEFEPLFLRPVNPDIDMNAAWERLDASVEHRIRMVQAYFRYFNDKLPKTWEIMFSFGIRKVCWRLSLHIENPAQQVPLSEAVRKDGFHVSNLYWPVNQFFNPSDECPNADYLARRILNLWVDESVNEDYVERCCESLIRHARELL